MTKQEKEKLLNDPWPPVSKKEQKAMMKMIKNASKAKIFEFKEQKEPTYQ